MTLHILHMLRSQKRHISFHTPGHKRAGMDITELPYSDDLSDPKGVLALAQADAGRILGAKQSFFLTDGSTCGVFCMLYALRSRGCLHICVPTYAHKSVFHACEVMGLTPVLLPQETVGGIPRQPSREAIAKALSEADALLLTSPDYYGFFAPLAAARELCDEQNKPLAVDGAHGSHLHGTPMHAGGFADLWVDGVHKSLPALTQGAIVSAKGDWAQALRAGVERFRTSSPSYPILASIEYAVKYPRNARIEAAADRAKRLLSALKNDDWTKIVLFFGDAADGAEAYLEAHGVYPEFCDGNYLLFYLSPATKVRELQKLVRLVRKLKRAEPALAAQAARACDAIAQSGSVAPYSEQGPQSSAAAPASEASASDMAGGKQVRTVMLLPDEAVGRVCARACGMVPPCLPLIVRGEVVTAEKAARLKRARHTFGMTDGRIAVFSEE